MSPGWVLVRLADEELRRRVPTRPRLTAPCRPPTALAAFAALVPEERAILAPPDVRDGHWITLEVQLFPDGRCGVAIDGVPRATGRTTISLDRPFQFLLGGNSAGTRMAIGPLEVWSGVRPDVPWKSLDR